MTHLHENELAFVYSTCVEHLEDLCFTLSLSLSLSFALTFALISPDVRGVRRLRGLPERDGHDHHRAAQTGPGQGSAHKVHVPPPGARSPVSCGLRCFPGSGPFDSARSIPSCNAFGFQLKQPIGVRGGANTSKCHFFRIICEFLP